MKKPKKLKSILRKNLIIVLFAMFIVTSTGSLAFSLSVMMINVRDMVKGQFEYIDKLFKHTLSSDEAGPIWLSGYTVGDDENSYVYILLHEMVLIGTDDKIVQGTGNNRNVYDLLGISTNDIEEARKNEFGIWVNHNGQEHVIFVNQNEENLSTLIGISKEYIYRNIPILFINMACVLGSLFVVLYFVLSKFLDKTIVKSIKETNNSLIKITNGDLLQKVDINTSEEFSMLSLGINNTVDSLKEAIGLAEAAAWMKSELSIASDIQLSCMPKQMSNAIQDANFFSLYADIKTAKEVGGDFYDYFIVGKQKLGFVIADVSGKGIPAAMFMMSAKTHIKLYMDQGGNLSDVFNKINEKLCENNDVEMFVTVFAGIIDLETLQVKYINAGHNPSVLLHNEEVIWLNERSGPLVGMFEEAKYKELKLQLYPEDLLFLYTDGVTEAANIKNELYGTQRLEKVLIKTKELSVREIAKELYDEILEFEQEAMRADDITMLLLKLGGRPL